MESALKYIAFYFVLALSFNIKSWWFDYTVSSLYGLFLPIEEKGRHLRHFLCITQSTCTPYVNYINYLSHPKGESTKKVLALKSSLC